MKNSNRDDRDGRTKRGKRGMHWHLWLTDDGRTVRVCRECEVKQVKVSGRWILAAPVNPTGGMIL